MRNHRIPGMLVALMVIVAAGIATAHAAVVINGTAGAKYLVSGIQVTGTTPAVFKITFENRTAGTNLQLCAGSAADFAAAKCGMSLASSGGPGFVFLTIVDMAHLSGKMIYVIRDVGTANSNFSLVIE